MLEVLVKSRAKHKAGLNNFLLAQRCTQQIKLAIEEIAKKANCSKSAVIKEALYRSLAELSKEAQLDYELIKALEERR